MSDTSTPPMSTKELKEIFETFSRKQLIDGLIDRTMLIRDLREHLIETRNAET